MTRDARRRAASAHDGRVRCEWAGDDPLMVAYHDDEWGVPEHDDHRLFELLTLEGAQAGLSWTTILRKRDGYRRAFADFDPRAVAAFGADDVERLLLDRWHRAPPRQDRVDRSSNAARVLEVQADDGKPRRVRVVVRRRCADRARRHARSPTCRRRPTSRAR